MGTVNVNDVEDGMVLLSEVSNKHGNVLLRQGDRLTEKTIMLLKSWGITEVDIKGFDERHLPLEGNIFEDDLREVWYQKFLYYRRPDIPDDCYTCEYYQKCGGGHIPGAEMGRRCIKPVLEMFEKDDSL